MRAITTMRTMTTTRTNAPRMAAVIAFALAGAFAPAASAGDWSETVEVRRDFKPIIYYRAKIAGEVLVVEVRHEEGWHTYSMDNKLRAAEKLADRKSLGIDGPTEINVSEGLKIVGPWRQSEPHDYSKPELRWFTWGYSEPALFAAKAQVTGDGPARVAIRGQACDATSCQNIDVALSLPLSPNHAGSGPDPTARDLESLVELLQPKE